MTRRALNHLRGVMACATGSLICILWVLIAIPAAWAQSISAAAPDLPAQEPPVPPGLPKPGAVAVALLGPGVDYRLAELQGRLARDGEGDLIGWDFSDGDNRPFAAGGPGTEAAKVLAALAPQAQLVVIKERPGDPQAFGHMMVFVAKTPAKVVVWPDGESTLRPDWAILEQAVARFADHLFVIPFGAASQARKLAQAYAKLRKRPNVIIAAAGNTPVGGLESADVSVVSAAAPEGVSPPRYAALVLAALAARGFESRAHLAGPLRSPGAIKQLLTETQPVGIARNQGGFPVVTAEDIEMAFRTPNFPR